MEKCRVLELIGGSLTDGGAETLVKDYVLNIDKAGLKQPFLLTGRFQRRQIQEY